LRPTPDLPVPDPLTPMEPTDHVKAHLMTAADLQRVLDRMARQVAERIDPSADAAATFGLVGLQTRGVHLARRLQQRLRDDDGLTVPVGILDATLYRDDVRLRRTRPEVKPTDIPFDVTGRHLVLVDDVLYTGRTSRSALDALMDMGRPASVHMLVMIDRGLRELPIAPDIVGREVPTLPGEEVRVRLREADAQEGVWLVATDGTGARTG